MRITRPITERCEYGGVLRRCAGFTLLELSAVVFIIVILVSLLCAALNHTKAKALRVTCLDNMKQLQSAWWLYAADNDESLPLNQTAPDPADARSPKLRSSNGSWVTGNPVEDLTPANILRGTLYPHVNSVGPYHCPMDGSTVTDHPEALRTRSYSMSYFLGGDPDLTIVSPKYKYSEIGRPDNVFVFIEEHEDSPWFSSFQIRPAARKGGVTAASSATWMSVPSDRHGQGCNISFADGHIEYWRWFAPKVGDAQMHAANIPDAVPQTRDFVRLQSCLP